MKRYKFTAKVDGKTFHPKGFYYQGKKHIVLVGDVYKGHTIRRKELVEDVEITADDNSVKDFRLWLIEKVNMLGICAKRGHYRDLLIEYDNSSGMQEFNL